MSVIVLMPLLSRSAVGESASEAPTRPPAKLASGAETAMPPVGLHGDLALAVLAIC